jgi:hypothetical protein
MSTSCLLDSPPIVERFDRRRLVRYRASVRDYARRLERACADHSAVMWANQFPREASGPMPGWQR